MGTEERDADRSAASAVVGENSDRDVGRIADGAGGAVGPVVVDEPPEPRRIRRQPDLMRLVFESLMIVVVLLLGKIGVQTTSGLESDIHNGAQLAPSFLLGGITVLTNVITAIIPVALAIERLARRDGRRVADAVIAAALAYGISSLLNIWIESSYAPNWLLTDLTRHVNHGTTSPLHIYIATLIAFLTVLGFNDRPTLRTFTWVCVGIYAVATLISGDSALVGLIVTFLLGRLVAFGYRYSCGVVNERPTGQVIVQMLTDVGVGPVSCRWDGEHEDVRRYEVLCADGRLLDVTVLDRDRQAVGLIYRIYRRIRLRGPAQRRNLFSLRRTVDQEALISYALRDAGIRTPELVAVRALSPDAAMLAYERVHARQLGQLPKEKVTDELLTRIWQTMKDLSHNQIAHRRLALDSILVDEHGEIWLSELRNGEVAADDLQLLLDVAEVMTALALKAGPARTVRIGAEVLGEDRMGAALPMLQPVVLTRTTRAAVRKSKHLLQRLREQILELRPQAALATEPVKLERLSPKTLLTVAAGCFAVYVLLFQLSSASKNGLNLDQVLHHMSPWWADRGRRRLGADLHLGRDGADRVHPGKGVDPAQPARTGRRGLRLAGRAGGGRRRRTEHPLHAETRHPDRPGGQRGGRLPGGRLRHPHRADRLLQLHRRAGSRELGLLHPRDSDPAGDRAPGDADDDGAPAAPLRQAQARALLRGLAPAPDGRGAEPEEALRRARRHHLALAVQLTVPVGLDPRGGPGQHQELRGDHGGVSDRADRPGSFIPVPAGVGTVETAMAFTLIGIGVGSAVAVPSVLLFSLLRTYLPAIPGYITFTYLTRKGLLCAVVAPRLETPSSGRSACAPFRLRRRT